MAANKRNEAERERDRAEIARRYVRGVSQVVIAEEMKVSQQQVSYDLSILRKRWGREQGRVLGEELAKIDAVETECWSKYQASRNEEQQRLWLAEVLACIDRRCKLLFGVAGEDAKTGNVQVVLKWAGGGIDLEAGAAAG